MSKAKGAAPIANPSHMPKPCLKEFVPIQVLTEVNFDEKYQNFKFHLHKKWEMYEEMVLQNDENFKNLEVILDDIQEDVAGQLFSQSEVYDKNRRETFEKIGDWEKLCQDNYYKLFETSRGSFRKWRREFAKLITKEKFSNRLLRHPEFTQLISWDSNTSVVNETSWSNNKLIPRSELKSQTTLGSGAFGDVSRGIVYGNVVAIKVLKTTSQISASSSQSGASFGSIRSNFERECALLSNLKHDNILKFMGASFEEIEDNVPFCALLTELAENGSLHDILYKRKDVKLSFNKKMRIVGEIVQGMVYLHTLDQPILHLDLKPANVLMDSDWHARIADFGLSKIMSTDFLSRQLGAVGTPFYMAPEVFPKNDVIAVTTIGPKSDVYSFGIMVNELVKEQIPYSNVPGLDVKSWDSLISIVTSGEVPGKNRPEPVESENEHLYNLICSCWKTNYNSRPDFQTLWQSKKWTEAANFYGSAGEGRGGKVCKIFEGSTVPFKEWADKIAKTYGGDFVGQNNSNASIKALMALNDIGNFESDTISKETSDRFLHWIKDISVDDIGDVIYGICTKEWFWCLASPASIDLALQRVKTPGTYAVYWWDKNWVIAYISADKKDKKNVTYKYHKFDDSVTLKTLSQAVEDKKKELKLRTPLKEPKYEKLASVMIQKKYTSSGAYSSMNTGEVQHFNYIT